MSMQHWTQLGLRDRAPNSARTRVDPLPERLRPRLEERLALLDAPLAGIYDGTGLRDQIGRAHV